MNKKTLTSAVVLAGVLSLTGCGDSLNSTQEYTLGGAALGAGTGAIIGSASGNAGTGAAIGAAAGAVGGALLAPSDKD